jgi:hypothetical protein
VFGDEVEDEAVFGFEFADVLDDALEGFLIAGEEVGVVEDAVGGRGREVFLGEPCGEGLRGGGVEGREPA